MPGVRLLDAVDREGADGVDRELIEAVRGEGHSLSPVARELGSCGGVCRTSNRTPQICAGMLGGMPALLVTRRARTHHRMRSATERPRVVVVGDIVVDVILAPERDIERGSDVRGRVLLRAGGSAATAARWLGRLGARSTLVCAVGRDGPGRALVSAATADGVTVRAIHVAGAKTARIGVFVDPDGQRSFVQDRGAALLLAARETSSPHGSRAPTPCISPPTRCSTPRSVWRACRRSASAAPPVP